MLDLGRQVMVENKLSIHVESGDIFYENHNTGEKMTILRKMTMLPLFLKNFLIVTVLKHISVNFCRDFQ